MSVFKYFLRTKFRDIHADWSEYKKLCAAYGKLKKESNAKALEIRTLYMNKAMMDSLPVSCVRDVRMDISDFDLPNFQSIYFEPLCCENFSLSNPCTDARCKYRRRNNDFCDTYQKLVEVEKAKKAFWAGRISERTK